MPTEIERSYVEQGYRLPEGLTWEKVARLRAHWEVRDIFVPIASGPECIGWGVPLVDGRHLKHP
jgi:hypothetical protein